MFRKCLSKPVLSLCLNTLIFTFIPLGPFYQILAHIYNYITGRRMNFIFVHFIDVQTLATPSKTKWSPNGKSLSHWVKPEGFMLSL